MELVVRDSVDEVGRLVADLVISAVRSNAAPVLGFATGSTPVPAYDELRKRHRQGELSLCDVTAFLLDEYVGIAPQHPRSYRSTIMRDLLDGTDMRPESIRTPDGSSPDLDGEAERYEAAIASSGGIDLQLLGIGRNGHIGFNEPGSSLTSRTRVVTLAAETRRDNRRHFAPDEPVPMQAITVGIGTILEARSLVLVATGEAKADALRRVVMAESVTSSCPASALRLHADVTIVADRAAARHVCAPLR